MTTDEQKATEISPQVRAIRHAAHETIRALNRLQGQHAEPYDSLVLTGRQSFAELQAMAALEGHTTVKGCHDALRAKFLANGWVAGEEFDPVKKTLPDLVVFEELAPMRQLEYALLVGLAQGMLAIFRAMDTEEAKTAEELAQDAEAFLPKASPDEGTVFNESTLS